MKILNLPGKTGKWMPIQSVSEFKKLYVNKDARLMYLEDKSFRDKYVVSKRTKRAQQRANKWLAKYA